MELPVVSKGEHRRLVRFFAILPAVLGAISVIIGILSLAAWTFFYLSGLPLDAAGTTIVVGVIALVVTLVSLGIRKLRKQPQAEPK